MKRIVMNLNLFLISIIGVTLVACGGGGDNGGENGGDNKLAITITSPKDGSTFAGSKAIETSVTGGTATSIRVEQNGKPLCDTTSTSCTWDTMLVANGSYVFNDGTVQLKATAFDSKGSPVATSPTVTVTVKNMCRPWWKDLSQRAVHCTYPPTPLTGTPPPFDSVMEMSNTVGGCAIYLTRPTYNKFVTAPDLNPPVYTSTVPGSTIVLSSSDSAQILNCIFK